ncbi:MAG: carbohydrate binding family 9 domain-containing protein, partial [Bacteroidales bacterium]|nr:carbohydrate binding family 9 domain-containing protein [Bacteroidales bacterium]
MHLYKYPLLFLVFISFASAFSQTNKKTISTNRVDLPPTIDGILDEASWQNTTPASNFIMLNPGDGTPERENQKSLVYILYDNSAIYIGAQMLDNEPDKILKELGQRDDDDKNADLFIFSINPYNDGQQVFNFMVTAAGVQIDTKYADGDEDSNWNAVWDSEVKIDDKGWVVEMKIPYSELRFPEQEEQVWGLNILRKIKRTNEEYTWNYIDKKVGEYTQHYGELHGIKNIKPPVRLSFMPYVSGIAENYDSNSNFRYNGGMDLKYGINESFTLDMTLIPDFSQTAYDEEVLNLSPFEIRYDENRQFFTEGTEMFSKGGLFYSRRIGGVPTKYYEVEDIPYADTSKA